MGQSANARFILTGGDDLTVRLWDTEAFAKKLASSAPLAGDDQQYTPSQAAAERRTGAVAADAALGWECVRDLTGHTAAVRDVAFSPLFEGPPPEELKGSAEGAGERSSAQVLVASEKSGTVKGGNGGGGGGSDGDGGGSVGIFKKGGGRDGANGGGSGGSERAPVKLERVLASASADLTLRIWDLSSNARKPRCVREGVGGEISCTTCLIVGQFAVEHAGTPVGKERSM